MTSRNSDEVPGVSPSFFGEIRASGEPSQARPLHDGQSAKTDALLFSGVRRTVAHRSPTRTIANFPSKFSAACRENCLSQYPAGDRLRPFPVHFLPEQFQSRSGAKPGFVRRSETSTRLAERF